MTPERAVSKLAWGGHDWPASFAALRGRRRLAPCFAARVSFWRWSSGAPRRSPSARRIGATARPPATRKAGSRPARASSPIRLPPLALRTIAHRGRGQAYAGRRLYEFAVLDFDEALKLSPQDVPALVGRARALGYQGQYDRAIADFSEVLRLGPRSDAIFNERGRIHLRKNDPVAAKADFDAAVLINPRNVHALNNRGLVLVKQHRLDEAIASYRPRPERRSGLFARLCQQSARLRSQGRDRAGARRLQAGGRAQGPAHPR